MLLFLPLYTIKNEVEKDDKKEKDKISVKTAPNVVNKSLEMCDCSPPLKHVKPDRTLQIAERNHVIDSWVQSWVSWVDPGLPRKPSS